MGSQGIWEISIPATQFSVNLKLLLKIVFLKKKSLILQQFGKTTTHHQLPLILRTRDKILFLELI